MQNDYIKSKDVNFTIEQIEYYPYHVKSELRILYVLLGEIEIRNVSGSIKLHESEMEFININEPAEITSCSEDNIVITMSIRKEYIKQFEKRADNTTFNINTALFYPRVERNTDENNKENVKKMRVMFQDLFQDYCKSFKVNSENMTIFTAFIVRCFNDMIKHLNYLANIDRQVIERFLNIENYIIENISGKIKLTDLAMSEYLSPQYLSSEFRRKFNTTFGSMLEYYRVKKAVTLMIGGDVKTTYIVKECGFSDNKYFYRAFKRHMGCTPSELRSKLTQSGPVITRYYEIDASWVNCFTNKNRITQENQQFQIIRKFNLFAEAKGFYTGKSSRTAEGLHRYCLITGDFADRLSLEEDECWYYHDGETMKLVDRNSIVNFGADGRTQFNYRLYLKKGEKMMIRMKEKDFVFFSRITVNRDETV